MKEWVPRPAGPIATAPAGSCDTMTEHTNSPRRTEQSSAGDRQLSTSRRTIMKATGTSAIAIGGLASISGSATAQEPALPPLARDGNNIVDPSGNEVILRGVNIADPGEQSRAWRGQTAAETFRLATDESEGWYTNVVRVPVQAELIAAGTQAPAPGEMPHGDDWGPLLPGQFDASDVEWYCQAYLDDLVELGAQRGRVRPPDRGLRRGDDGEERVLGR